MSLVLWSQGHGNRPATPYYVAKGYLTDISISSYPSETHKAAKSIPPVMAAEYPQVSHAGTPPMAGKVFFISGIATTVYGLEEIPEDAKTVAILWVLHGRGQNQAALAPIAVRFVRNWYENRPAEQTMGLIAVTFDSRNHGTRLAHPKANQSWKDGNPDHAQDMLR